MTGCQFLENYNSVVQSGMRKLRGAWPMMIFEVCRMGGRKSRVWDFIGESLSFRTIFLSLTNGRSKQ